MLNESSNESASIRPGRPHRGLFATEMVRATSEFAALAALRPLLAAGPRGDGHPVIVLPGFTAGDSSTAYLRRFLRARGHHVHGWELGPNLGPTSRILRGLEELVASVNDQHQRKCSVVGWSLGGTFARELARSHPDKIRQVVTLGTPLRLDSIDQVAAGPIFKAMSFLYDPEALKPDQLGSETTPLVVPSTSIYSRADGFVPWQLCVDEYGYQHESVEVCGSHLGLGHNPAALAVVANRLALAEDNWTPFTESRLSRLVSPRHRSTHIPAAA